MSDHLPPYQRRLMAFSSYLGVLCLIPLIFNTEDEYVSFHARQGLVLWMWGVLSMFTLYIPVAGAYFSSTSYFLIIAGSGYGILSVLLNERWKIPFIFGLSEKL
ncbi:conserved membrane hypothetical protein [Gammaproteobacteria bacterium]